MFFHLSIFQVSKSSQTRMYSDTQVETVRFDQLCPETVPGVSNTGAFLKAASPPDGSLPNPKLEQPIKVKEESPEGSCAPPELGCVSVPAAFAGVEDDFCPDSLSLAQSRLLEDWRPEPLHLQNCDTDALAACTSHSLCECGRGEVWAGGGVMCQWAWCVGWGRGYVSWAWYGDLAIENSLDPVVLCNSVSKHVRFGWVFQE